MWTYNNELYHYGVPGMKWGHRKLSSSSSTTLSKRTKSKKVLTDKQKETKKTVRKYQRAYDKAMDRFDLADEQWDRVRAQYKTTGKNAVSRIINNVKKNKDPVVKEYQKARAKAVRDSNLAEQKWTEVQKQYKTTGKNAVSRIINNVKYGYPIIPKDQGAD